MKKSKINKFIEKAKSIHGDKYNYEKVNYVNTRTKVSIICPEHGEFFQLPDNHLKGNDCPKCANTGGKLSNIIFIERANKVHNNKYVYNKTIYIDSHSKIIITCPNHGDFLQKPYSHLNGQGCKQCYMDRIGETLKLTTSQFINKANKIHNNKYDYSKVIYSEYYKKVKIKCRKHGYFYQKPSNHLAGKGCNLCRASKGELVIKNILDKNKIINLTEYKIPEVVCNYEYDFYLPEYRCLIEFHGIQHYKYIPFLHRFNEDNFLKQKERDIFKKDHAYRFKYRFLEFNYKQLDNLSEEEFEKLILKNIR